MSLSPARERKLAESSSNVAALSTVGAITVPLWRLRLAVGAFHNPRTETGLEEAEIEDMAASIEGGGLFQPLIVQAVHRPDDEPDEEPVYLVLNGQRRYLALEALRKRGKLASDFDVPCNTWRAEPVVLDDAVAAELYDVALDAGLRQAGLSTYEVLAAASSLADRGVKQVAIAQRIKRSEAWVSRMLKAWYNSTPALRDSLRKRDITDEQFKDLAAVKVELQAKATTEIVELRAKGGAAGRSEAAERSRRQAAEAKQAEVEEAQAKIAKRQSAQIELAPVKPAPAKERSTPAAVVRATLDELVALRAHRPKTPYVRGVLDGAALLKGDLELRQMDPVWRRFLDSLATKTAPSPAKKHKSRAMSKGCRARHHHRCQDKTCTCKCHGGKA